MVITPGQKRQTDLLNFFGGAKDSPCKKLAPILSSISVSEDLKETPPESRCVADIKDFNFTEKDIDLSVSLLDNSFMAKIDCDFSDQSYDDFDSKACPERYQWLINIRDAAGRSKTDPNYDPRTLYIPQTAWASFTPFEKQYWEVKKDLLDTIVFCKKGKFYEVYEMDADIACQEFDLKVTERVNMRMAGVPEASFDLWTSKFIAKGYKIAQVDQVETAISKSIREKDKTGPRSQEKIIRRELTRVLTAGTIDEPSMLPPDRVVCIALRIPPCTMTEQPIGVAILDASLGSIRLFDFFDDRKSFDSLKSFLIQMRPKEILIEKLNTNPKVADIIREDFFGVTSISEVECPDKTDVIKYLASKNFLPENLNGTESASFEALGIIVWYLKSLKTDEQILAQGNIGILENSGPHLVIDGQSLLDLDIISSKGMQARDKKGHKFSLFDCLDFTCTDFGRRLLSIWVSMPLMDPESIQERLDTVDFFLRNPSVSGQIRSFLHSLPDLERYLARVRSGRISVKDFISLLDGFKSALKVKDCLMQLEGLPTLIANIVAKEMSSQADLVTFFVNAFDREAALKEGCIIPKSGIFKEYDVACTNLSSLHSRLDNHRLEQEKVLRTKSISYRDMGKDLFQLEVSADVNVPSDYVLMSRTKTVRRYWTPQIKVYVREYLEWTERKNQVLQNVFQELLSNFSLYFIDWKKLADAIAQIDCLQSLAQFSRTMDEPKCRPIINSSVGEESFSAHSLRHPCFNASNFIPNDIFFSGDNRVLLITGPNMGGKSTLLRMISLTYVLAQIGAYVPASDCRLTPVDRIFTRLGASDNIMAGKSTFMVELSDAVKIMRCCTSRSLVLLDELGRGTSTFDGMALAHSVLLHLMENQRPIVLFSTHYRSLAINFSKKSEIKCMYMAYHLDADQEKLTLLYKLTPGVSPRSFGIQVANMAGLPWALLRNAETMAKAHEMRLSSGTTKLASPRQ